jgi:predicted transcriptional regulator
MKKKVPPVPKGWFTVEDIESARGCSNCRAQQIARSAVKAGLWERREWPGPQRRRFIYREKRAKSHSKD